MRLAVQIDCPRSGRNDGRLVALGRQFKLRGPQWEQNIAFKDGIDKIQIETWRSANETGRSAWRRNYGASAAIAAKARLGILLPSATSARPIKGGGSNTWFRLVFC